MIHLHWFIIAQVLGESNRIIHFPVILPKDSFITIMKESMSFHTATSVLEIEKLLNLNKMKIVIEECKRPVSNTNFYSFSECQNQISIS